MKLTKAQKKSNLEFCSQAVYFHAVEFDYEVTELSDCHWRLTKEGKSIDIWPTTMRYTVLGSNEYRKIGEIEDLLKKEFVDNLHGKKTKKKPSNAYWN